PTDQPTVTPALDLDTGDDEEFSNTMEFFPEPSVSSENSSARDRMTTCWRSANNMVKGGKSHPGPAIPVRLCPFPLRLLVAVRGSSQSSTDRLAVMPPVTSPWLQLALLFEAKEVKDNGCIILKCLLCMPKLKKISTSATSYSNFKKHMKGPWAPDSFNVSTGEVRIHFEALPEFAFLLAIPPTFASVIGRYDLMLSIVGGSQQTPLFLSFPAMWRCSPATHRPN
ncbi:hypothetical protein HPB47_015761, partial [Ixodes persulcatus]